RGQNTTFLNGQNTTFLKSYYTRFGDKSPYVNLHAHASSCRPGNQSIPDAGNASTGNSVTSTRSLPLRRLRRAGVFYARQSGNTRAVASRREHLAECCESPSTDFEFPEPHRPTLAPTNAAVPTIQAVSSCTHKGIHPTYRQTPS
ncbi:hypothetical protein, partial [Burkholderia ubonensis]|uniref:hypothetical protein n=1 Tax=Burkholderia ubonensis TaxID=101571 RepID=UPI001E6092A8